MENICGDINGVKVGIFIDNSPASINLFYFVSFFKKYNHISIVVFTDVKLNEHLLDITRGDNVSLLNYKDIEEYDNIEIAFLSDFNHLELPLNVIKVAVPHGVDIPMNRLVDFYLAPMYFDYILNTSGDNSLTLSAGALVNKYPSDYLCHNKKYICEIPFGNCKLDYFYEKYHDCDKNAIIYHLSSLEYELSNVDENMIKDTLISLVFNFPEHEIIFRPFPSDLDNQIVKNIALHFSNYNKFKLSTSLDYVDDYVKAFAMISHRPYRKHAFSIVGGSFFCYIPFEVYEINYTDDSVDSNQIIQDESTLITKIKQSYASYLQFGCRVGNAVTYNLGHSIDYLVEHLEYIILGKRNESWRYFDLSDDGSASIYCLVEKSATKKQPFDFLAHKLINVDNNSYHYYLLALSLSFFLSEKTKFSRYRSAFVVITRCLRGRDCDEITKQLVNNWWISYGRGFLTYFENAGIKFNLYETWLAFYFDELELFNVRNYNHLFNYDVDVSYRSKKVILYGAGEYCELLIDLMISGRNFAVAFIVDSNINKVGSMINGFPVKAASEVVDSELDILICSEHYYDEIKSDLMLRGVVSKRIMDKFF